MTRQAISSNLVTSLAQGEFLYNSIHLFWALMTISESLLFQGYLDVLVCLVTGQEHPEITSRNKENEITIIDIR